MSDESAEQQEAAGRKRKERELDDTDRQVGAMHLFWSIENGKLRRGEIKKVARDLGVNRNTIGSLWRRARGDRALAELTADFVRPVRKKHLGLGGASQNTIGMRSRLFSRPFPRPSDDRCEQPLPAWDPKTTVWNWILGKGRSGGFIRRHSNAVKPFLTEENKTRCIEFVQSFEHNGFFQNMEDIVHVDEKWFYMTELSRE